MPLFNQPFISEQEDLPYFLLATEWGISTGLCQNWDPKLKWAKPLEVIECLPLVPTEEESECTTMLCWRDWILLSA